MLRSPDSAAKLKSRTELLEKTSILAKNFRDHSPIKSMEDSIFDENNNILEWLEKWEAQATDDSSSNSTFTSTTIFDLKSVIIGFKEFYKLVFDKLEGISVCANKVNTDIVENTFSQARARKGQNDNPAVAELW